MTPKFSPHRVLVRRLASSAIVTLATFAAALCPVANAQDATPKAHAPVPGSTTAQELERQFQEALDRDVIKPHDTAMEQLNVGYCNALEQAVAAASKAANLTEALALREEKTRIESNQAIPTEDSDKPPLSLSRLRRAYTVALARLGIERDRRALPLQEKYMSALAGLQKTLTVNGDLQGALAVAEKVKNLSSQNLILAGKTPALAKVEVEEADLMPFRKDGQVYGDRDIYLWEIIPPDFDGFSFWRARHALAGTLRFKAITGGKVYMACTDRWTASGAGAGQLNDLMNQEKLEKEGWRLEKGKAARASREAHTWIIFSRMCKAGETFSIRTEKYCTPLLLVKN